ncbi:MAG: site-specific DNA-methyltransferase, partial [Kiritimatiellae bacterium]|nr:site-specific DNA-methyltransferase [Kiritimatiellia bacterium]
KVPHYYNYDLMRKLAGDKQMTDVWRMPAIAPWEKSCGKHPTQKPLALMVRAFLASTKENALVLDPFAGSGSTGIAANLIGRRFIGIEREREFVEMAVKRREQMDTMGAEWAAKIKDISILRNMI